MKSIPIVVLAFFSAVMPLSGLSQTTASVHEQLAAGDYQAAFVQSRQPRYRAALQAPVAVNDALAVAEAARLTGHYQQAFQTLQTLGRMAREKIEGNATIALKFHHAQAALHTDFWNIDRALDLHQQLITRANDAGNRMFQLRALMGLAENHLHTGDILKAESMLNRGLATAQRALPAERLRFFRLLAAVQRASSRFTQARRTLERAVTTSGAADHPELWFLQAEQSRLALEMGGAGKASRELLAAERRLLRRVGARHPLLLRTQRWRAMAMTTLGNGSEASDLARRALDSMKTVFGEQHPALAAYYVAAGDAAASAGNNGPAVRMYQRAHTMVNALPQLSAPKRLQATLRLVAAMRHTNQPGAGLSILQAVRLARLEPYDRAQFLEELARCHLATGDANTAFIKADEAQQQYQRAAAAPAARAENYLLQAEIFQAQTKWQECFAHYTRGLRLLFPKMAKTTLAAPPEQATSRSPMLAVALLAGRGRALREAHRREVPTVSIGSAVMDLRAAAKRLAQSQSRFVLEQRRMSQSGRRHRLIRQALEALMVWQPEIGAAKTNELAFELMELDKSASLRTALQATRAMRFSGVPPKVTKEERHLQETLRRRRLQFRLTGKPAEAKALAAAESAYTSFIGSLESDYPAYFRLKHANNILSLASAQDKLAEGEAALSYFVDGGTGFGMITTRDTAAVVPLTEAGKLGKLAQLFRSSLRANDHGTYNGAANRLYTTTVQPLLAAVETEPSTLVVYPDGPLFSLPFEAFATEPGPADYRAYPFLIRQHAVRYGYGATLDAALHRDKSTSSFRLLGVAPQFKGHMEETLLGPVAPLPGTADELRMIEVEYGTRDHPTQTLLGQNATEEALKTLPLADFDIIHLATHGFVNPSNPGLSGLVLASAPAAATDEDNLLFAEETYALDLNARLVVLSACQTGLGSFVGGEGLLGLSRGFLYAGARQLAVSLWQVSDNGTRELMKSFHLAMLQGKPPGVALRSAKLKLLEHPQHSRPYYWAPFVLIGPGGTTG